MSTSDTSVVLPKKRVTGESLADVLTDNALNNIIPARYLIKDADGNPVEEPENLFERVAKNIAVAEAVHTPEDVHITPEMIKPNHPRRDELLDEVFDGTDHTVLTEENAKWVAYDPLLDDDDLDPYTVSHVQEKKQLFQRMMESLSFIPNSPTIANAGDELQQLSACFVLSPRDDIEDIHEKAKQAALVFQSGGGTGYAFSYLRPYGDTVGSTGGIASGPITFMRTFDQLCRTIAQGGMRRGAQMGIMRCTHPDVIQFIHAKNKDVALAQTLRLNDPKDYRHTSFEEALDEARGLIEDGKVPDHLRNAAEGHLANFNISVGVTDEFMQAVKNREQFEMINPRTGDTHVATQETKDLYSCYDMGHHVTVGEELILPARELYERIVDGAHENGEPGVFFIDRANDDHSFPTESTPVDDRDDDPYQISSTNPCGEQPLLEHEACNLGHVNLSTIVADDAPDWRNYDGDAESFAREAIDMAELRDRVVAGTRFLDNVVTMSAFPVPEISETVSNNRKIGLGIMGLAQMLVQMGVKYGSNTSAAITHEVMTTIEHMSKQASNQLAQTRGSFSNWEDSKYAEPMEYPDWFQQHTGESPTSYEDSGYAMRNHNTMTVAPTGTTSMLGNTSGGCEPIYEVAYQKNVGQDVQGDEQLVEFDDYFLRVIEANGIDVNLVKEECQEQMLNNEFDGVDSLTTVPDEIGELFVVTEDLSARQHAKVQCAVQRGVDSAVSKTVNFPNSASKEDVAEVIEYLHENGAKGGTIYRDGTRSKQVLSTESDHGQGILADDDEVSRDEAREMITRLSSEHDLALEDVIDSRSVEPRERPKVLESRTERIKTSEGSLYVTVSFDDDEPFEVISTIGKSGGFAESMVEGLCRMASQSLRAGVPVAEVIDQLYGIRGPDVSWDDGEKIRSIPDAIAKALQRAVADRINQSFDVPENDGERCPECDRELIVSEGCLKCPNGHISKCG